MSFIQKPLWSIMQISAICIIALSTTGCIDRLLGGFSSGDPITPVERSVSYWSGEDATPVSEKVSPIFEISLDIKASEPKVASNIVNAKPSVMTSSSNGTSARTYQVTYSDSISYPKVMTVTATIKNISNRAVPIGEVPINYSNDLGIKASLDQEINADKKLTPGSTHQVNIIITNLPGVTEEPKDIILTFFEMPYEVDESGSISKRDSVKKVVRLTKSTKQVKMFDQKYVRTDKYSFPSYMDHPAELKPYVK